MTRLEHAIKFAVQAHTGQTDKVGAPYILHPLRVMFAVQAHGEDAMCTAVLHDVLEDCDVHRSTLALHFGDVVATAVQLLSRPAAGTPGRPTYAEFIRAIRDSQNEIAMVVKTADLRDNLSRISSLPADEQDIRRRYERALRILGGGE